MKLFSIIFLSVSILAACSTPETAVITEPDSAPVEISNIPDWYSNDHFAASDSAAVFGFAMASAADSVRAVEYARQSAVQNLKFEIDRLTEVARLELAESSSSPYSDTAYIINLRNVIRDLQTESADYTFVHDTADSGIHYVFAKAVMSRVGLIELLESELSDQALLGKLR